MISHAVIEISDDMNSRLNSFNSAHNHSARYSQSVRSHKYFAAPPSSLIPQTLEELEDDKELQELYAQISEKGQATLTQRESVRRQKSLQKIGASSFMERCRAAGVPPLVRAPTSILQLNIGLYCNQACRHCHVESSPLRTETMSREVADRCLSLLKDSSTVHTLDLTGGAPELAPQFRYLVEQASAMGITVIDRCNLTVLMEPGQEDLAEFLAKHRVRVVASLPCYSPDTVNKQRGGGVFDRSIRGLLQLNSLGYGRDLVLDLVYNPSGVFLAPDQATLEVSYRQELREAYGIEFTSLLALNNMPIKRWTDFLIKQGKLEEYMALLVHNFNPAAAHRLMCRDTVSVGWDGRLYDCDFNQQLDMPVSGFSNKTVFDMDSLDVLVGGAIATDSHCFGCTAGSGSGCQGSTL